MEWSYCFTNLGYEQKWMFKKEEQPLIKNIIIERCQGQARKTSHITSNYIPEDLGSQYDAYFEQMIFQYYNPIFLDGPNLR